MIQILYAQDHTERGVALSQAVPGSQAGLVTTAPTAKPGLDTLTFWGHGDIARLCGLQSEDFAKLVKDWAKLNSGLQTVEIITCNARHAPTGFDPYAQTVVSGLRSGLLSSTRNIVVKALPVNVGGTLNAFSILLAHAPNKSWCYVTGPGPDDKIMFQGNNLVKAEAGKNGYDLAQAGNKVARDVKDRKFTLNFGYFNTLRAQLGVVR
jgi:hypothetical protein